MDKFQYYLTDEDGKFYYVEDGVVKLSADPKVLPQTPSGWQDLLIGWERNLSKYGIVRSFTLPLGFVMNGARIIRELFYTSNIEKEIHLVITKLNLSYNSSSFKYDYSHFYEGELDLSTFKDEGDRVSVNVMEGSYAKKLKASEATPFEIPFDQDKIRVKMDGVFLYQKFNYLIQSGPVTDHHLVGLLETTREGGAAGLASFTAYKTRLNKQPYTSEDFTLRNDYFLAATQNITGIHIKGSIKFTAVQNASVYKFLIRSSAGRDIPLHNGTVAPGVVPIDMTFDVFAGENLFLLGLSDLPVNYEETEIKIDFKSRYPSTYIYAFKPFDLGKKLYGGKILGDESIFQSTLLNDNANLCVTCGDAVRSIPNAVIKTSGNNFFEAYNTILNAGLSLEGNILRFESKDYYFNTTDPIDLGEVKELKLSVATDLMVNTVKIGYPVQNTDDVNGKSAFNNTHVYSSPVTRVVKELGLICPYITDPYAIEIYRDNTEGKTTTDNSSDNEVMILNVDLDNPQTDNFGTYYNLKRETYTTITGIPDPATTFNIEQLTPKTLLGTHQSYIDSIFYGFTGEDLTFQTTEKNAELYREKSGVIIDEDADFTITDTPYFIPYYVEFDTKVPIDLASLLGVNPNKCFTFTWKGETWEGFLMKAAIAPNDNKPQAFKLLLTPNNDLTKLI